MNRRLFIMTAIGAGAFAIQPALAGKVGAASLSGPSYAVLDLKLSPQA